MGAWDALLVVSNGGQHLLEIGLVRMLELDSESVVNEA
jgi:hypothetical protein